MDEKTMKALYHEPLVECWRFFKEYCTPDGTDEFWSRLVNRQGEIYEKYNRSKFVLELSRAFVDEIERIERNKQNNKS